MPYRRRLRRALGGRGLDRDEVAGVEARGDESEDEGGAVVVELAGGHGMHMQRMGLGCFFHMDPLPPPLQPPPLATLTARATAAGRRRTRTRNAASARSPAAPRASAATASAACTGSSTKSLPASGVGGCSADDGPENLREACRAVDPLWVVFEVSGNIHLQSYLCVASYKTIGRGQSVVLAGKGLQLKSCHHVIVCNLLFEGSQGHNVDDIQIMPGSNIRIDRCTLADYDDGLVNITCQSTDITVLRCHFARHDKTMLIGADPTHADDRNYKRHRAMDINFFSVIRNLSFS